MPTKREWSPPTKSSRTKRTKFNKKTQHTTVIPAEARQQQRDTIRALLPRERIQVTCRDKEFRKFLLEQYRIYCPEVKCGYRKVSSAVISDCIDWIEDFKGVNKKTDDALTVDRRFDLAEGRSWVDQRRSKKIIPLFLWWLDTICKTVKLMQAKKPSLPHDLEVVIIEKLLTTSYHPQSSQSNQTLLVCQQSLHTKQIRKRLKDFDIVVPESKKRLGEFISDLRNKVEDRRLGLRSDAGRYDVQMRSDDSDSENGSVAPSLVSMSTTLSAEPIQTALMAKEAELSHLQQKYEAVMDENRQLRAECLVARQKMTWYGQQSSMMHGFSAWASGFVPSPDQFLSSSATSSPPLSTWSEPVLFPPQVDSESRSDSSPSVFDGEDYTMADVGMYPMNDVPTRMSSGQMEEMNSFLNMSTLGY